MTTQYPSSDIQTRLQEFKPKDVKNLVQQQGKIKEGDNVFILEEPAPTDQTLHAILDDPNVEIKSIGNQTKIGEMYFDLKADGRQVRIKVICQNGK